MQITNENEGKVLKLQGKVLIADYEVLSQRPFRGNTQMFQYFEIATIDVEKERMFFGRDPENNVISLSTNRSICTSALEKNFTCTIGKVRYTGLLVSFFNKRKLVVFENEEDYQEVVRRIEKVQATLENVDMWCME